MGMKQRTNALFKLAESHYEAGVANGTQSRMHGWNDHVLPTALLSREIAKKAGGSAEEQELAFVAGLLHDWKRLPDQKLKKLGKEDCHERDSAAFARKILQVYGYSPEETESAAKAIASHSFGLSPENGARSVANAEGIVARALKAADKAGQLGAEGVWRRNVFLGEAKPNFTLEQARDYYGKRIKKFEEFAAAPEGKTLLACKGAKQGWKLMREYEERLHSEEAEAKKSKAVAGFYREAGATGMFLFGFGCGAKGWNEARTAKAYAAGFPIIRAKWLKAKLKKEEEAVVLKGLAFTKRLLV
ncbi:hypothetical protein AUJ16_02565 [Candidatus Micrarchaeota archaeon CG1_02_60_51]|nr:MAG: hypothetical protein AUJ16_02565 [Candidatus Micrarchaeota archaeon CG1_02_60_51]